MRSKQEHSQAEILAKITNRELDAELCKRSFREFREQAWSIVEPASPLLKGYHSDAIAEHLQAVGDGQIQKLLINVPPGHAKSLDASVLFPAWQWARRPAWRVMCSSYALQLAVRDSVKCRMLLDSPWYTEHFRKEGPDAWQWQGDMNLKTYYANDRGGFRLSLSVDGQGTGYRGDAQIVDDPLNAKDAHSELARKTVIRWWDETMSSRFNNQARGVRIIIMQRLHEEDLSGHVLAQGGYEHLCLPSQFEAHRKSVTYFRKPDGTKEKLWEDPRTEEGELLFPDLFPREVIEQAHRDMGSDAFAGQHQQSPVPAAGNMFKRDWFRFFAPAGKPVAEGTNVEKLPASLDDVFLSVDASFKGGVENDFVVIQVWGTSKANRFLLHQTRQKMGFTDTVKEIKRVRKVFPRAFRILIEDKANGSAIIDSLKSEGVTGVVAVNPEGGKEARAAAVQPQFEAGNVYLPLGENWVDAFVSEFLVFPRGKHDDQVDAASQALIHCAMAGLHRLRLLAQL